MVDTADRKELFEAIAAIVKAYIKKIKYNSTMHGVVKEVLGNNQYIVNINNLPCTIAGTTMPTSQYYVGDIVLIELVDNDFSFKYIKCKRPY